MLLIMNEFLAHSILYVERGARQCLLGWVFGLRPLLLEECPLLLVEHQDRPIMLNGLLV